MDRMLIVSFISYLCIFSRICFSLTINNSDAHKTIEDRTIVNSTALLNADDVAQSSSPILETENFGIKSPNITNAATKISKKSRPKERKSLKERSRRQGVQSGYTPGYDTLASSRLFDMCPQLGFSCPTCTDTDLQLPPNFCRLNFIAMKVILISAPMTDAHGRVCGKFGLLTIHGNADVKDFRRLLRFSVQESCGCHLKASRQYYLISPLSAFFREEQLFNKIILTDQVRLISFDRYIDRDILQVFKDCYAAEYQPYTTLSYFSPSDDPQIVHSHSIPSNQPQATYSHPALPIQPRTANTFPVPPVQLPPQNPTPSVSSLYYDKLSLSSSAPTSLHPISVERVSGSYDENLSPPLEQRVSSHLQTAAGLYDEAQTYPLQSNFRGCTVPSTCPQCYIIETIPDITQHYCASNYAFVAVLKIPDLPPVASLNYTSMCLNLPTNIIYDVSKHIDPKVVVNSITAFLPLMCSGCLSNLKGPVIVLLISEVIPAPPATQLDGNFRLFILPVPSTITLPNCDLHYPTLYSFRLNKPLQYASPDCPANFEQTCSSCYGYSEAVLAKACEGGFAIVAEIEHAGSHFISQRIPPISVRTTRTYYSKSVEITANNPPSNKCVQGYLKIIANIKHPLVHLYPRIPFISLPNCGCLPQASSKLLIFSSRPLVLSPAGALHLTKDIHTVFLLTNHPMPKCNEASPILQKPIQRPFTPTYLTLSPPVSYIPSLSKHPVDLTYVPPTPPPPVYRYNYLPPPLYITPPSYIFPQASYTSSPKITYPINTPDEDLVDNWWVDSPGENEKVHPIDKPLPPIGKPLPPVDKSLPPVDKPLSSVEEILSKEDALLVGETLPPVDETLSPDVFLVDESLPSIDKTLPSVEEILSPEDALLVGETLPPVDETLSPDVFLVDESLPPIDKPLFPLKDPLLPVEEPLPSVEEPLPPVDEAVYVVDESLLPVNETLHPVDKALHPFFFEHNSSSAASTNLPKQISVFGEQSKVGVKGVEEVAVTTLPITIHRSDVMKGTADISSFDVSDPQPSFPATTDQGISFVPCLFAEEATCPQTVDETQKEFSDLYCYSKFAFVVAVGFNASYLTKDEEGGELRILTSADPEIPFIGIDYGGKSKSRELTVTVTPAKTMERRAKQPRDETVCYHEKILGLYDLSPESVPRELLQDLDIYIPSSCDSSIFDIRPVYGILLSEEQPNLNNTIQLTEEFVFFPLSEGRLTLPSCHLESESPITTKYQVQVEENPLPHVICHASGCPKWISVKDEDYSIPCDMKFAALVMIEETSAGKNIAPNLEIFESFSDTNTPLYSLKVTENTEVDTYEDPLKPVQVKYVDGSKYCKYAALKIIKNLFPAAAIKQDEMLTVVAEKECNNPVFKMVKGVALLLSKKLIEPNTAVPLDGDTIMVGILPGTSTIFVCPQSTSTYFQLVPDSSAYETVISSYTEAPETLVVPESNEETFHEYGTEPTYPATTIKYEEPPQLAVVDSLTTARTAPIIIQKPLIEGEEIAGTGASYCDGHKDQTCPVCGEINSLSSDVYCNAKSSLFARSTGYHYRNHTCSSGVLGTLYDITVGKVPMMALLRVLYSIPPHCSCPALERDGYLLLISEEYIPLASPLTLQLSKGLHIYTADRGRSLLPGCVYSNPIQARSKILKNMVEMESVDKELHAILPELSYPSCPTIDHTCPKCGGMSDQELEELICSAEEVLLVSKNKTTAKIPTKSLRTGKTIFTQHLDKGNYVLEMNIDQYENTCTFPLAKGNCTGSIPRYYFDAEDEMCIEFEYSGCNGNANNFQSSAQCEDNCLIEDFCIEGSLSIEKIIKNSYASDYLNNEFIYAFPEHCNCWHMLQENVLGYLISEKVTHFKEDSIQLSRDYYFVPLTESQKSKKFFCIFDYNSMDLNEDAQIKKEEPKEKKKAWGLFG